MIREEAAIKLAYDLFNFSQMAGKDVSIPTMAKNIMLSVQIDELQQEIEALEKKEAKS